MSEQLLRQAKNEVLLVGQVSESTLEKKEFVDKHTGKPYNVISGDVTIKVSEDESHTVSYFSKELNKDGGKNKGYQALETAMDKLVTIADIAQGYSDGKPSAVVCKGSLGLNEYKGADGNIMSFPKINGSFAPSTVKGEKFEPSATFDIEGIVKKVVKEQVDGEETGRVKLELYVPLYGGKVVPLGFISDVSVGDDGVDYIEDNFVAKSSINIWGKIINKFKEVTRTKEGGFGQAKEETTTTRIREFAVTGGDLYEEDGKNEKLIFDIKLLKEALANRERDLAALRERESSNSSTTKKNPGFGSSAKNESKANKKVDEDLEDELGDLFGED